MRNQYGDIYQKAKNTSISIYKNDNSHFENSDNSFLNKRCYY